MSARADLCGGRSAMVVPTATNNEGQRQGRNHGGRYMGVRPRLRIYQFHVHYLNRFVVGPETVRHV
jgi:hypothetical protein